MGRTRDEQVLVVIRTEHDSRSDETTARIISPGRSTRPQHRQYKEPST